MDNNSTFVPNDISLKNDTLRDIDPIDKLISEFINLDMDLIAKQLISNIAIEMMYNNQYALFIHRHLCNAIRDENNKEIINQIDELYDLIFKEIFKAINTINSNFVRLQSGFDYIYNNHVEQ